MEISSKFKIDQRVLVDLGLDGSFTAIIEGIAYNKGRIFYCVKAGLYNCRRSYKGDLK